jgi:hypothetical protein
MKESMRDVCDEESCPIKRDETCEVAEPAGAVDMVSASVEDATSSISASKPQRPGAPWDEGGPSRSVKSGKFDDESSPARCEPIADIAESSNPDEGLASPMLVTSRGMSPSLAAPKHIDGKSSSVIKAKKLRKLAAQKLRRQEVYKKQSLAKETADHFGSSEESSPCPVVSKIKTSRPAAGTNAKKPRRRSVRQPSGASTQKSKEDEGCLSESDGPVEEMTESAESGDDSVVDLTALDSLCLVRCKKCSEEMYHHQLKFHWSRSVSSLP